MRVTFEFARPRHHVRGSIILLVGIMIPVAAGSASDPASFTPASSRAAAGSLEAPPVPSILLLEDALELGLSYNPGLGSTAWDLKAAESRRVTAGRRPNPSIGIDAENWGGALGSDRTELTLGIEQPIEIGGDRGARVSLAEAGLAGARASLGVAARDLAATVTESFLAAWVAQERLGSLQESRRIAVEAVASAAERFKAGAAPTVERVRAEGNLAFTEARVDLAGSALASARRMLALHWGSSDATFDSLGLPPPDLSPPPHPDSVLLRVREHPELFRASAELKTAEAIVRATRASRVPDIGVRIGVRHLRDAGGTGFVAGLLLPLPLWNTQGGSLAAAEAGRQRALLGTKSIESRLASEVHTGIGKLEAAISAFHRLGSRAAPAAEEALTALRSTYRAGRLSYTDLLEAQRALLEARLAVVEATAGVWRARADLARLTGSVAWNAPEGGDR